MGTSDKLNESSGHVLSQFERLAQMVRDSVCDDEKSTLFRFVTEYLDFWIGHNHSGDLLTIPGKSAAGFLALTHMLRWPSVEDQIWRWLRALTSEYSERGIKDAQTLASLESSQSVLCVSVYSTIFHQPIEWDDEREVCCVNKAFELLEDAKTSWAVYDAYVDIDWDEGEERIVLEQLQEDLSKINVWRTDHELRPISLNKNEALARFRDAWSMEMPD